MWKGQSLSVVLPTYNERDSIAGVIRQFESLGFVDDIVVVNNNAVPGTSAQVARTGAREVVETRQGYGAAIQRGLREVDTDLVCLCEPDGTFDPTDLHKLLPFTTECDVVIGSRTVSNFIWDGANMGWFLQWGNWSVAKLIEVLYNTSYLSDVGCTFRVMSREQTTAILERSTLDGSAYGLEMLLLAVILRAKLVQVPVNYLPRVGVSSVTGDLGKTIRLGCEMIVMVLRMRLRRGRIRRGTAIQKRTWRGDSIDYGAQRSP
jgi:glycosyltransferase involved in cell wall biosynthesis